jgi:hypothetical protein
VKPERVGGNNSSMEIRGRGKHQRQEESKEGERNINMSFITLQDSFKSL